MIRRIVAAVVAGCLPASAFAEMSVQNGRYTCDRGVEIPVVYVTDPENAVAILVVEGNQVLVYAEDAASGVRYGWPSDGSNYVWWTKGTDATLYWRDAVAKTETALLENCKQN